MSSPNCKGQSESGTDVVRTAYDWSSTKPSTGVVEAVATTRGDDPTTLDPLYDAVDPDALDAFFRSNGDDSGTGATMVSFLYAGHDVTVYSDGPVVVQPTGEMASEP